MRDETLTSTVIEAQGANGSPAVVALGASTFATDAWIDDARRANEPYLTVRTVRQTLAGPSPIVPPGAPGGRYDGGRGLNILMLHYGEAAHLPSDVRAVVRYRMFQAACEVHRGYRIELMVQEFWDEIDPEFVIHGWGRVWSDYSGYYERLGVPLPPAGQRPYLIGITRQDVAASPGEIAAPIFVHVPPRLAFTRAEQRMLQEALLGRTDLELAHCLRLAVPTVKSRWRGIYNRVAAVMPDLFPQMDGGSGGSVARGLEKRRRLLEYVRRHPEELRPGLRADP